MKIGCLKFSCSECCKRYWITLLPAEAKKIALFLGMGEKEFIAKNCVLIAHLYAREQPGNGLTINSEILPKKTASFAEQELGFLPQHFLVLPALALKRNSKGECTLLGDGKCKVHSVAPVICRLFPFVAMGSAPLRELYPFCIALQREGFENAKGCVDEKQRQRVNKYFHYVGDRGFLETWGALPASGILLLEGEQELRVSRKEFLQLIQPFL